MINEGKPRARTAVLNTLARISHQLSLRNGGGAAETRRTTEAAAGVLEQYVEEADGVQRSICEHIRRCSRQLGKNAGWLPLARVRQLGA